MVTLPMTVIVMTIQYAYYVAYCLVILFL